MHIVTSFHPYSRRLSRDINNRAQKGRQELLNARIRLDDVSSTLKSGDILSSSLRRTSRSERTVYFDIPPDDTTLIARFFSTSAIYMYNLYCSNVIAFFEDSSQDTPMDYVQIHAATTEQRSKNKEAKKLWYVVPAFRILPAKILCRLCEE